MRSEIFSLVIVGKLNFAKWSFGETRAAASALVEFVAAVAASLCDAQPELLITRALRRPQGDG
jgi:hypothetical protein